MNKQKNNRKNPHDSHPLTSKEWPGYMKEDFAFFATKISEIGGEFAKSPHPQSQRLSRMLITLSEAMIEDGYRYYLISESIGRIWSGFSKDWNRLFVQQGGQMNSGKIIAKEVTGEMERKLSVYPTEAYNLLQYSIQGLKAIQQCGAITGLEAERMYLVALFVEIVHQATLLDHWFDRVEDAILNPLPTAVLN